MPAVTEPKLIAGNANLPLAKSIARRMSMHRGMSDPSGTVVPCPNRKRHRPAGPPKGLRLSPDSLGHIRTRVHRRGARVGS